MTQSARAAASIARSAQAAPQAVKIWTENGRAAVAARRAESRSLLSPSSLKACNP
jgi:hypothetical protein